MTILKPRLVGKVALVTGGSRGIGAAIARAYAAEGARVAVLARRGADDVAREVHGLGFAADVTDETAVTAAVEATVAAYGRLDLLVANAGRLWLAPTADTPLAQWERTLAVNLTGVFVATKAALPHLPAGGACVALTTTGVGMTELGSNAYWVAKAGVERYYAGLAAERPDLAVACLAPSGVVLTEGWDAAGTAITVPPEMVEPASSVAEAAVLLAIGGPRDAGQVVVRSRDVVG